MFIQHSHLEGDDDLEVENSQIDINYYYFDSSWWLGFCCGHY